MLPSALSVSPLFGDSVHYEILLFGLIEGAAIFGTVSLLLAERVDQVRNLRSHLMPEIRSVRTEEAVRLAVRTASSGSSPPPVLPLASLLPLGCLVSRRAGRDAGEDARGPSRQDSGEGGSIHLRLLHQQVARSYSRAHQGPVGMKTSQHSSRRRNHFHGFGMARQGPWCTVELCMRLPKKGFIGRSMSASILLMEFSTSSTSGGLRCMASEEFSPGWNWSAK